MIEDLPPPPPPFWHRLNSFFAFPLQLRPLAYALVLSFCSLLFDAIFFLPDLLALVLIEVGIVLAASRYGFKITALGARGIRQSSDFGRDSSDEWTYLPWKLFAISLVQGSVAAWLSWYHPLAGIVALFVMSFSFPAAVIVLVQSGSFFQAMNPGHVIDAMRIIGWPYALLCFFLFLLSSGAQIAIGIVLPMVDGRIMLPIVNFAFIYFGWVTASLLGYVMYQHHDAFGIDAVPGAGLDDGAAADRRTPEQIAAQRIDAEVAQLITEGDLAAALGTAYEAQRTAAIDDLAAQRRYHRVLAMVPDKQDAMLDHARRFIALLMRRDLSSEALKVFKACREKDKAFALDDAAMVIAMARAEWRNGDAHATLALLSGFDRRFRGHEAIPQAYELAARALVQGLGRADMARPILRTLESRYPESEQTQEVRWLMRPAPAA
ncbi:tetratricopeptide repeat protein [Variovorax boronicumulans]|uniref:tetratricopeptide repeat protein n=1 Tax=Variovorax boronicumulans TaxID=436515 RepID=UPI003F50EC18